MLKKITILAFVAVMAVGMAYAATGSSSTSSSTKAADSSSASKPMTSSKSAYTKVEGTFVSMDAKAHTITVTVGTDNKTYTYGKHTSCWNDKKAAKLSSLKAGDKVTISVDSKNYAHKVEVATEAAAATTK